MNDGEALLRAVLIDPADDAARLVYADWLQEHGQPGRAEFIRDQVWVRPGTDDWDLLDGHLEEWCPWFARCGEFGFGRTNRPAGLEVWHGLGEKTTWTRGFISRVQAPCEVFLLHAAAIFAAHPVTEVRPHGREPVEIDWRWTWLEGDPVSAPAASVPPELWRLIELPFGLGSGTKCTPYFDTAHKALSAACVRLGRAMAGLPPLKDAGR